MAGTEESSAEPLRGPNGWNTIVFVVGDHIGRGGIPELCERLTALLEDARADLVICDVSAVADPDAVTVDALARLQLTARRLGHRILLVDVCGRLQELLGVMGLADVIPLCARSLPESKGQAEQREEAGGVEKEADPGDLTG